MFDVRTLYVTIMYFDFCSFSLEYEINCSFENGALRSHGLSPFLVLYVQRVVFLVLLHSACPTRAIPCPSSLCVSNS